MKNVVDTAIEAGNFKNLVRAVQEAGLVDTLADDGPFTIFAPTDEAFSKLPEDTIENLLKDKERLTEILTYHVIPIKVMVDSVKSRSSAATVNGRDLSINVGDDVKVNNAHVIQADIECSNGVIHVIDTVLIPE